MLSLELIPVGRQLRQINVGKMIVFEITELDQRDILKIF